jgi:hypothetical protein
VWLIHVDEMPAAKSFYFNLAIQTQDAFLDRSFKHKIRTVVRLEDIRYRAVGAVFWFPGWRSRIAPDQATFLLRLTAEEVFVIKLAFVSSWVNHAMTLFVPDPGIDPADNRRKKATPRCGVAY